MLAAARPRSASSVLADREAAADERIAASALSDRTARPGGTLDAVFQLAGLLIEQKVVVAEMRSAHVPMEVLSLQIKSKGIGKQRIERGRYLANRFWRKVGWRIEPSDARFEFSHFAGHGPTSRSGRDVNTKAPAVKPPVIFKGPRHSIPVIRITDIMEYFLLEDQPVRN